MVNTRLAALRFLRRGSRLGIVALYVAVFQITLVITACAAPIINSQAVNQRVNTFTVSDLWISINSGDQSSLGDSAKADIATRSLSTLSDLPVEHLLTFRPVSDKVSGRYQFVATQSLNKNFELTSGSWPTKCSTEICEVVAVNQEGLTQIPDGFVVVGQAEVLPNAAVNLTTEPNISLLVSNDIKRALTLESFRGFPGIESWVTPTSAQFINNYGLEKYLAQIDSVLYELSATNSNLQLLAPSAQLALIERQTSALLTRIFSLELALLIIIGLLSFLSARSKRHRNESFVMASYRLRPDEISRFQINTALAFLISIIGWLSGSVIGSALSFFSNNEIVMPDKLWGFAILTVISASVFLGLWPQWKLQILAILPIALVLFIGNQLNLNLRLTVIATLAGLVSVLVSVGLPKLFQTKFSLNTVRSRKLELISLTFMISFLSASLILAFADYQTLNQNVKDNAVFNAPTLSRITAGSDAQPMQFNDLSAYQKLNNGDEVYPVRKVSSIFVENALISSPTLLVGVNPEVWQAVPNISHQTKLNLATSKQFLTSQPQQPGIPNSGKTKLSLSATGIDEHTYLSAWFLNNRNESIIKDFTNLGEQYSLDIPIGATNLIGFQVTEFPDFKSRRDHAVGEGNNSLKVPQGILNISNVKFDNELINFPELLEYKNIRINSNNISGEYTVVNGPVYMPILSVPRNINAIVDSQSFERAKNGKVNLRITNTFTVELNAVAKAERLPTVPMRFSLISDSDLTTLLAAGDPQLLHVSEIWLTNEIKPTGQNAGQLFGLTLISQSDLLQKNLSVTNSIWTKRGLFLFALAVLILLILLTTFLSTELSKDQQLFGWLASGISKKQINKELIKVTASYVLTGLIGGTLVSIAVFPQSLKSFNFDINGNEAIPPLVSQLSLVATSIVIVSVVLILGLILATSIKKTIYRNLGVK